jgi:hypothetical protein
VSADVLLALRPLADAILLQEVVGASLEILQKRLKAAAAKEPVPEDSYELIAPSAAQQRASVYFVVIFVRRRAMRVRVPARARRINPPRVPQTQF